MALILFMVAILIFRAVVPFMVTMLTGMKVLALMGAMLTLMAAGCRGQKQRVELPLANGSGMFPRSRRAELFVAAKLLMFLAFFFFLLWTWELLLLKLVPFLEASLTFRVAQDWATARQWQETRQEGTVRPSRTR